MAHCTCWSLLALDLGVLLQPGHKMHGTHFIFHILLQLKDISPCKIEGKQGGVVEIYPAM